MIDNKTVIEMHRQLHLTSWKLSETADKFAEMTLMLAEMENNIITMTRLIGELHCDGE